LYAIIELRASAMNRRRFLKFTAAGTFGALIYPTLAPALLATSPLVEIERQRGGRLGVAIWNIDDSYHGGHRIHERFMLCSTYKLLLVAQVLARMDSGHEQLDTRIAFDKSAVLDWAPVTLHHAGQPGMTIEQLCKAAIVSSDNTAANLLMNRVGGPPAVTAFLRNLGDSKTRVDRMEPDLNHPDGDKDTTTPKAIIQTTHKILLGDVLSSEMRQKLLTWLKASKTGQDGLRKGLPPRWEIGEKTGANGSANNDIAIIWPGDNEPVLAAVYYENTNIDTPARKQVLAEVGHFIANKNGA
jgi:beta-lactamase class A